MDLTTFDKFLLHYRESNSFLRALYRMERDAQNKAILEECIKQALILNFRVRDLIILNTQIDEE